MRSSFSLYIEVSECNSGGRKWIFCVLRAFLYVGVLYVANMRFMIASIGPAAMCYMAVVCVIL